MTIVVYDDSIDAGHIYCIGNNYKTRKNYGIYRRNGKIFIRDYGRDLKNGKGMSAIDVIDFKTKELVQLI